MDKINGFLIIIISALIISISFLAFVRTLSILFNKKKKSMNNERDLLNQYIKIQIKEEGIEKAKDIRVWQDKVSAWNKNQN